MDALMATRLRSERGQATTETILLTWIILIFWAAAYQVFLVNQSVFRSMTAVHQQLFERAFPANCYDKDDEKCRYSTDGTANVIWRLQDFPELAIRTVTIFQKWGLDSGSAIIQSNVWPAEPEKGCPLPCKHTKMSVGTYWPILGCALGYGCLD